MDMLETYQGSKLVHLNWGKVPNVLARVWMVRVCQKEEKVGHRMGSTEFISKFQSVVKGESTDGQLVTDLVRVQNMIGTFIKWPQMGRGQWKE
jgi:hypothetical protein